MRGFVGVMVLQDGHDAQRRGLGFGTVMDQCALQRRMRGGTSHPQQRVGKLDFDAQEFLKLGEIHVLEAVDDRHKAPLRFDLERSARAAGTATAVPCPKRTTARRAIPFPRSFEFARAAMITKPRVIGWAGPRLTSGGFHAVLILFFFEPRLYWGFSCKMFPCRARPPTPSQFNLSCTMTMARPSNLSSNSCALCSASRSGRPPLSLGSSASRAAAFAARILRRSRRHCSMRRRSASALPDTACGSREKLRIPSNRRERGSNMPARPLIGIFPILS